MPGTRGRVIDSLLTVYALHLPPTLTGFKRLGSELSVCGRCSLSSPGTHLCVTAQWGNNSSPFIVSDVVLQCSAIRSMVNVGAPSSMSLLYFAFSCINLSTALVAVPVITSDIISSYVITRAFYPGFLYVTIKLSIHHHPVAMVPTQCYNEPMQKA